ncbi:hypothetical protein [Brevundimonas sp.]|uniref:hypothetical protein n=1 Tax=Brevundimonas sp. TaxID=1871086 RepID=UPI00120BFB03|nr:hypothetical protein [Brevundimonas sp.]TAJ65187.1 MAG: hypothetical protein EPO49_03870 [Brevundimonas sp.]
MAILLTGAGAVIGAVVVGLRQASISERQATISERQAEIQEHLGNIEALKVRADLFERRQVIYRATNDWLSYAYAYGRVARPYASAAEIEVEELTDEEKTIAKGFQIAVHDSRFLFRPAVHDGLRGLRAMGTALRRTDRSIASEKRRAERRGDEPNLEKLTDQQDRQMGELEKAANAIDQLFLPELNLGDLSRPNGPKSGETLGA